MERWRDWERKQIWQNGNTCCRHWIHEFSLLYSFNFFYTLESFRLKSQHKRQKSSIISMKWGSWFLFRLQVVWNHVPLNTRLLLGRGKLTLFEALGHLGTRDRQIWLGIPHHAHCGGRCSGSEWRTRVIILCKLVISLFVIRFA